MTAMKSIMANVEDILGLYKMQQNEKSNSAHHVLNFKHSEDYVPLKLARQDNIGRIIKII